jgi:hypothetical protein
MSASDRASPTRYDSGPDDDPPALVVVVNRPIDLQRAMDEGWYRIPLGRAPHRIAADYLAFYQTGAFAPEDRWLVRWIAPVFGYHLATRRKMIPDEPVHPRADDLYFRISLGELSPLERAIPSRRLRRITFIPTTLGRLHSAVEINDLWIRRSAQEHLWRALQAAGVEPECEYPLHDDVPDCSADLALFCRDGRIAVLVGEDGGTETNLRDDRASRSRYLASAAGWLLFEISDAEVRGDPAACTSRLLALIRDLGGPASFRE